VAICSRFVIPLVVLGEQQQMMRLVIELPILVLHAPRSQIGFQSNDRLDALLFCLVVEIDHPIHRAMIGDGDGGQAEGRSHLCTLRGTESGQRNGPQKASPGTILSEHGCRQNG